MISDWVKYIISIFLMILVIAWGCQGAAETAPTRSPACWDIQQACDELIQSADELILLQAQAYQELNTENERLDKEIMELKVKNFTLSNPPWYKDPVWMGLAGSLLGAVLILKYK